MASPWVAGFRHKKGPGGETGAFPCSGWPTEGPVSGDVLQTPIMRRNCSLASFMPNTIGSNEVVIMS